MPIQLRDCVTRRHLFGGDRKDTRCATEAAHCIVDDDVSAREALEGFLKAFGYTTDH
jgi:hypothetical protein